MAKVKKHYHYDSEDGLLDEIEKLTAPPGMRVVRADREPVISQKNWKSVNTQYCIVCREGGELLCCDTCPASFHLLCHQPIIYRDEIPDGKWMCNRCAHTPPEMMVPLDKLDQSETEEERNRRAALRVIESASESCSDPLSILAQAALVVNAQHFEVPRECEAQSWPFDYVKKPKTDTFGKRCKMCHNIVEKAPLTKCDFCDGFYHLDCMDPPLCSQPKGKWMCPNHVEHIIDQKLLKSCSIIERSRLWNEYGSQKIDEIAITRAFLSKTTKIKKKNGPKRGLQKGQVQASVKEWYRKRFDVGDDRLAFATESERGVWLDALVKMHTAGEHGTSQEEPEKDVRDTVTALLDRLEDRSEDVEMEEPTTSVGKWEKIEHMECDPKPLFFEKQESVDLESCLRRLENATDPGERAILSLAVERLEQLKRKTAACKKERVKEKKYTGFDQRHFVPEYPILAVLKAEGKLPVAIQRGVTSIGTAANCHVILDSGVSKGVFCSAHAPNHAAVVFDRVARRFELLPTGCNQVTVDGVVYGSPSVTGPRCSCSTDRSVVSQAAPLHHGSSISIGCSTFVFASYY